MGKDRKDGLLWEGVLPSVLRHTRAALRHTRARGYPEKNKARHSPAPPLWMVVPSAEAPAFAGMTWGWRRNDVGAFAAMTWRLARE